MLDHALDSHLEVMNEVGGAPSLFGVQVEKRDKDAMRRILREAIRIMKALGGEKMTVEREEGRRRRLGSNSSIARGNSSSQALRRYRWLTETCRGSRETTI